MKTSNNMQSKARTGHVQSALHARNVCRKLVVVEARKRLKRKHLLEVDYSQPPATFDYVKELNWRSNGCRTSPPLFLAPMENLADRNFRMAFVDVVGGMDEACTEFIRIPGRIDEDATQRAIKGVCTMYNAWELGDVPLGAQIMGSSAAYLAEAAHYLACVKHAPRVDLNCGCPANTVTGNGAGSSLLQFPSRLEANVRAMVGAVPPGFPVSVKLRAGFKDTGLFRDNLLAAQEAGASFITLHPRTKVQCYDGRADWALIRQAKELLRIPVVGNGDVVSSRSALQLAAETGCDGIMVGRGAVSDPLLFHRIHSAFDGEAGSEGEVEGEGEGEPALVEAFIRRLAASVASAPGGQPGSPEEMMAQSRKFGRLKKVIRYLFSVHPALFQACEQLLRVGPDRMAYNEYVEALCAGVRQHWPEDGPAQHVLFDHMKQKAVLLSAA